MLLTAPATPGRPGTLRGLRGFRGLRGRRVANRALAVVGAMTAGLVLVTGQAGASANAAFVAATNQARAAVGLPKLTVSADLTAAATHQAQNMADAGALFHTPNLGSGLCCWVMVGENVGKGPSESLIQAAFMASPEHRANILRAAYGQIGIGYVIDKSGTLWVSEIFRRPIGSAAPLVSAAPAVPVTHVAPKAVKHETAKPVVAAPRTAIVRVRALRPPLTAVTTADVVPAGPVSRSLVRLPLGEAERVSIRFGVGEDAVAGTDPVSRLLDFAAKAAGAY